MSLLSSAAGEAGGSADQDMPFVPSAAAVGSAAKEGVFQFEVLCRKVSFGCLIPLQVEEVQHSLDPASTADTASATKLASVAGRGVGADGDLRTVYLSDLQQFMLDLRFDKIRSSIAMDSAMSLLEVASVTVTTSVILNISHHAAAAVEAPPAAAPGHTAATAAMTIAKKIGVQHLAVDVSVRHVAVTHNEVVAMVNHCFPELLHVDHVHTKVVLYSGRAGASAKAVKQPSLAGKTGTTTRKPQQRAKLSGECTIDC